MPTEVASDTLSLPPAEPKEAAAHFARLLAFETDCWDVHAATKGARAQGAGFVLLDVRSPESFAAGHVPGAINLPRRQISERSLARYPDDTLFFVYCDGPQCNGADKAALAIAQLGRPVKKMIGGICGWKDDGFELSAPETNAAG